MNNPLQNAVCRLHAAHDLRVEQIAGDRPGPQQVLLRMQAGGICGSDLHYFLDGGFGPVRVREPIILGHEASGIVEALGDGVSTLALGTLVAVNPSQPCGHCRFCNEGLPIHCLEMRFMGSAMRLPHEQGMFRETLAVNAAQCYPMGDLVTPGEAACCEPLSVCLHAVNQAGDIRGKRVLITGAGPIGALTAAAARQAGAGEIIVTDLQDFALATAMAMGADRVVNVGSNGDALADLQIDKGMIDVAFECSAAPSAIRSAIACVRPRGTIIQVGVAGDTSVPLNAIVGKEITYRGTQRFHAEFAEAARLISTRTVDVRPIISGVYPLEKADEAFAIASDRSRACKVQLTLGQ
ncbi:L-idonate 5-dehydrogenase [Rhizobium halophytocola]|uniref:L-idonate 5-dehydrogenase n=1 Tax=Rhizobium halophytocola TaxID=735519 RepID=A0ABS4E670_9HYPH|nr:L-idonate 5-dehydrogenase [Rhizobium halophytocola]MBP1853408.1 L-idonate 5-dehydrogenase [Rhizobium halophytocola]